MLIQLNSMKAKILLVSVTEQTETLLQTLHYKCFIAILLIDVLVSVTIIAAGAYCFSKESMLQINNLYLKFKFSCKELQATKTETTDPLQKSV